MVEIDGGALRNAEFASLTSRPVTDQARHLIDEVHRKIEESEERQRQRRGARALSFHRAVGAFLGDLLPAAGHNNWVFRSVAPQSFTTKAVSHRNFIALRAGLLGLKFITEKGATTFWSGNLPYKRFATRYRATAKLVNLAKKFGVPADEAGKHFIKELPKQPLVLKASSTRQPRRDKVRGKNLKISYTDDVRAIEQAIKGLNAFLDKFPIGGGVHRGYVRQFDLGDHPEFRWNLGGRLYSQGKENYQQMPGTERLKMTIGGEAVCEIDIRASFLTIFHARQGQPLNQKSDPYVLPGLGKTARDAVKTFITTTFGNSQFPAKWSQRAVMEYTERTGENLSKVYPVVKIREQIAKSYPLLGALCRNAKKPPIWAELMFLESEAVIKTMIALQGRDVPSLSVHDSLIVQQSQEALATKLLAESYQAATTAIPHIRSAKAAGPA